MHVLMQNVNATAHVLKKAYQSKESKKISDWNKKKIVGFTLNNVWIVWAGSRLNSMHMLCGANNTTRPGNLRSKPRAISVENSLLPRLSERAAYNVSSPQRPFLMIIRHLKNMSMEKSGTSHGPGCVYNMQARDSVVSTSTRSTCSHFAFHVQRSKLQET